jgi:hypothetical protein
MLTQVTLEKMHGIKLHVWRRPFSGELRTDRHHSCIGRRPRPRPQRWRNWPRPSPSATPRGWPRLRGPTASDGSNRGRASRPAPDQDETRPEERVRVSSAAVFFPPPAQPSLCRLKRGGLRHLSQPVPVESSHQQGSRTVVHTPEAHEQASRARLSLTRSAARPSTPPSVAPARTAGRGTHGVRAPVPRRAGRAPEEPQAIGALGAALPAV